MGSSIRVEGTMRLRVDKDLRVIGAMLEGGRVDIRAGSVVVESLVEVVTGKAMGFRLDLDMGAPFFPASVEGNRMEDMRQWVAAYGGILGRDALELVVAGQLKLIGGMVAQAKQDPATGELTDEGEATIRFGSLVLQRLDHRDRSWTGGMGFGRMVSANLEYDDAEGWT